MTKSEIKFTVTLDDNMVAEKIDWSASDANQAQHEQRRNDFSLGY